MTEFKVQVANFKTTINAIPETPPHEVLRMAADKTEQEALADMARLREAASQGVRELILGVDYLSWLPIASAPTEIGLRIIGGILTPNGNPDGSPFVTFMLPASKRFYLEPTHWFPRPVPPGVGRMPADFWTEYVAETTKQMKFGFGV